MSDRAQGVDHRCEGRVEDSLIEHVIAVWPGLAQHPPIQQKRACRAGTSVFAKRRRPVPQSIRMEE
jgi:hypothetical protein